MLAIETKNLTKQYGKARGIEDVNLAIKKGEIFGFVGPNGAGKSTTIKCIMNLVNKNDGEIRIEGELVQNHHYKMKEKIGYLPSEIHLYEDLTVEKMLQYSEKFYHIDCSKRKEELIQRLEIDTSKKIDELSLGNLKKVGIILAFMHNPRILILDEATSGLDPLMQEKFYGLLREEKQKGTTIFYSSHALNEIKKICDRVGIIKEGKLVEVARVEELTKNDFVKVSITTTQTKEIKEVLNSKVLEEKYNYIKILFEKTSNELIQTLKKYDIQKLLIEEPSIEEIFMHYYE